MIELQRTHHYFVYVCVKRFLYSLTVTGSFCVPPRYYFRNLSSKSHAEMMHNTMIRGIFKPNKTQWWTTLYVKLCITKQANKSSEYQVRLEFLPYSSSKSSLTMYYVLAAPRGAQPAWGALQQPSPKKKIQ
jgi:hypothetical protein